ncbi:MAG: aldo/keto reductase [Chloroflexota bacterium]|nr:aldo/keto reductase [Chloroflexota bacterium]
MKQRPFGKTGLQISEVIFGAGAVGGLLINADDATRRAALWLALDRGVNWVDTAPSYGDGKSEIALGWLLAEIPEERRPIISTKVQFDPDAGDFAGQAERSMIESLERLRMDSVDVIQVHNALLAAWNGNPRALRPEEMLGKNGVADALDHLVDQGLARYVGFSGTGEAAAVRDVLASGRFASAQIYYNFLNPSAGRAMLSSWDAYDQQNLISTAAEHDVAVMAIRVFAAGVIPTDIRTGREGGVVKDNDVAADERRMAAVLPLLKPEHGARAQVAIRYALRNSGVSGVLVGVAEIEHLSLALEAAEMGALPDDLSAKLDRLADANFV